MLVTRSSVCGQVWSFNNGYGGADDDANNGDDDDDDDGSVMMIVLERHCGSELELLSRARDLRMKIYQCTRQYPF